MIERAEAAGLVLISLASSQNFNCHEAKKGSRILLEERCEPQPPFVRVVKAIETLVCFAIYTPIMRIMYPLLVQNFACLLPIIQANPTNIGLFKTISKSRLEKVKRI